MTEQIAQRRPGVSVSLQRLFVRIGVLPFLLAIALIVFSALSPRFLTSENLITVARQATYLAIVSMGQMLALLTGGFDLSVGKIIAITSVITAMTMAPLAAAHPDAVAVTLTLGILAGVGAGTLVGAHSFLVPVAIYTDIPFFPVGGGGENYGRTNYAGVAGYAGVGAGSDGASGVFANRTGVTLAQLTSADGASNTILVGERPPSSNMAFGWWFAGAGWDGSGAGDVLLGAREVNYAAFLSCPTSFVGLQPGDILNPCHQVHFWSFHSGGANFLFGDGSVHFLPYSANAILPALATRAGGEIINTGGLF